jgi:Zn-dependent metalloprotease
VPRDNGLARLLAVTLAAGALVAVAPAPSGAADPVDQALARLVQDADRPLTIRASGAGTAEFVGVPARADVDNPAVRASMSPAAAAAAHVARYGAAFGTAESGTTLARTDVSETSTGDVVRYQQRVDGVPVLGGQVVVSMGSGNELSSILAETSDATSVAGATVTEDAALDAARAAFVKRNGAGDLTVESDGRWLLDAGLVGGDPAQADRTVWRVHVSRGVDQRRQVLVDDRTGGILMDTDEIAHADRVVCDNGNVRRANDIACTAGFARVEGGPTAGADVNTAYDLSGVVSDFYQQVGGTDLTGLLGINVGGVKKLASTVRWCYTTSAESPTSCPYDNAFWNGSQMYYGQGYAGADDVVGHEITHGFTERNSGLFYWGQSGAMNESISDIIGEIVDHRHGVESDADWNLGEDIPGYPTGLRNMKDPTLKGDPDKTSSTHYVRDSYTYPDNDGVHTNSGVGNKTAYLISQGGSFNGQTMTGIDSGDTALTKSAKLWLLVDQTLTSGSDYADEAAVLDQSCQALLAAGTAGFTAADCAEVHKATLATELRQTPTNNPQPADAEATCPTGVKRVLFDSETGAAATKLTSTSWSRDGAIAHTGPDSWSVADASTTRTMSLAMSAGVPLPAGQASYLHFQQWRALDWEPGAFYDAGTVEVDDTGDAAPAADAAGLPWVNGPTDVIDKTYGTPTTATVGFGGDSRGFVASRADLSSYAGKTVKAQFTLSTDSAVGLVGWALDDITVYTCDDQQIANTSQPTISGTAQVGATLMADAGTWTPDNSPDFAYQWLRDFEEIPGATGATYEPVAADIAKPIRVRVTATKPGYLGGSNTSAATQGVVHGTITAGTPTIMGAARVGQTVTASPGTWAPSDVVLAYQWFLQGSPISGATGASYLATPADRGNTLSVEVTATKPGFLTASAKGTATAAVVAGTLVKGKPTIKGKARVGSVLAARPGSWGPAGVSVKLQWLRNGKPIKKATKARYKLVGADKGKKISVRATGVKAGYTTATATSRATGKVKAKPKKRR